MKKLKAGIFPFIIAISALSVSASAAFYSVSGLSKLFAGAAFAVVLMAGSLEVAKLVIASLLYQYWDNLNKWLRAYLSIAALVLVLITSMGIYGFLSAAYQDTYRNLSVKENKIAFLTQKKDFYESDVKRYDTELNRISENISVLSNAKVTGIQVRDTTSTTGLRNTISTTELRLSQQRITVEEENRKSVQFKREIVADSLQKYQLSILTLENDNEATGELGPLQYLSGLTGLPMDKIINVLLLIIIFVFDPLAIALVIAANFAFDRAFPKREYKENIYGEIEEQKVELYKDLDEEKAVDFFDYIDKDAKIESLEETLDKVLDDIGVKKEEKEEEVIELTPIVEKEIIEEENIIVENNKPKDNEDILAAIYRKQWEKEKLGKYTSSENQKNKLEEEIQSLQKQLKLKNDNNTKTY